MEPKIVSVVVTLALICSVSAQEATRPTRTKEDMTNITEPLGGKPSAGAKPSVADLAYQVAYQRAFEAVIWSMPAVGAYGFYRGAMDIGAKDNTILSWSQPAKPNAELLTANNQSPWSRLY